MSILQDTVRQRRSIRSFKDQPIPESLILRVIDASRWAPSVGNIQPWRIILIVDEDLINELIESMSKRLEEITFPKMAAKEELNSKITSIRQFTRAPVFIIPCMTKEVFGDRSDLWLSEHTMGVQSVAAAIQNMLLVAHDAGLGGCWCSTPLICPTAIRQILNIPQSVEPQAIIALGYSDETPEPPARRNFSDIVFLNKWNNRYKPSTYKPE